MDYRPILVYSNTLNIKNLSFNFAKNKMVKKIAHSKVTKMVLRTLSPMGLLSRVIHILSCVSKLFEGGDMVPNSANQVLWFTF